MGRVCLLSANEQNCKPQAETKTLSLNLTERCNLACSYCYQVDRRDLKKKGMTFEEATSAISEQLSKEDEFNKVVIELIGGEVLLYWSLVKDIITWTLDRIPVWKKKNFMFFIDTNGTLLNDEMKSWFSERKNHVTLGLSLDGTPEAQNINRSGSYHLVAPNIPFFANTWPNQTVKMTISPQTIPMIFDGIIHIMQQGLLPAANVPLEDIWGSQEEKARHVLAFKKEIEKLVEFFGSYPELPLPSIIDLPIYSIVSKEDRTRPWCGSGRSMLAMDPGGQFLPCNRYAVMSFDQSLFDKPVGPILSKCRLCKFRPSCQTCEAHNWEINGNPNSRTNFHCEFSRLQIWGTALVHTKRLEKRVKEFAEMLPEERAKYSEEAKLVNQHLQALADILQEFEGYDEPFDPDIAMPDGWRQMVKDEAERGELGDLRSPNWTLLQLSDIKRKGQSSSENGLITLRRLKKESAADTSSHL